MEVQEGAPVCPDVNCRVRDSVLCDKQSRISGRRTHGGALGLHAINLPLWVDRIRCMDPQRMEGKTVRYDIGHYSGCVCDFVCGQERNLGKPEGAPGNAGLDSSRANRRLGRFYHDRKELAGAIMHYRKALDILPNFPYAWNDLGGAYEDMGDLDRAKMHYNEALKYHPGLARAHYGLGQIHSLGGRVDGAIVAYEKAIRWDEDYVEAYNNLATVYANSGRLNKAEELWLRTLEIDPEYGIAHEKLEKVRAGLSGG